MRFWAYSLIAKYEQRLFSYPSVETCFGCSNELPHRDGSFEYPQHMFWLRNKKNNFQLCTLIWRPVACAIHNANSKGAYRTAPMRRLVCTFAVCMQQSQAFSWHGQNWNISCECCMEHCMVVESLALEQEPHGRHRHTALCPWARHFIQLLNLI